MNTNILKLSNDMMALATASESMKLATKKKVNTKDFVGTGVKTIIGTSLLKTQANLIGGL